MADLNINPAFVKLVGTGKIIKSAPSGADIQAGEAVRLQQSGVRTYVHAESNWDEGSDMAGIALNSASINQPVDILTEGELDVGVGTGLVEGTTYCLSSTVGKIAPDADVGAAEYKTVVGVGLANNRLKIKPVVSLAQIPGP